MEPVEKQRPVGELCERVMDGLVLEALLELVALGDVSREALDVVGTPVSRNEVPGDFYEPLLPILRSMCISDISWCPLATPANTSAAWARSPGTTRSRSRFVSNSLGL